MIAAPDQMRDALAVRGFDEAVVRRPAVVNQRAGIIRAQRVGRSVEAAG